MDATDSELWAAVREGDRSAFSQLFDRHARRIYNFAFRRTGNWSAAEDLLAMVFLEAWRRRHEVRLSSESALPWLYGVATNILRNHRRTSRRHHRALERLTEPESDRGFEDDVVARLDDQRMMTKVLAVLGNLPLRDQEILTLCLWEDLSYEDAALALGVPVGTVRSRLSRARARLRDHLGEPEQTSGHEEDGRPVWPPAASEECT